ncbi:MAG: hypothetical protein AAFX09_01775 [Pseudomonadota bacterium]
MTARLLIALLAAIMLAVPSWAQTYQLRERGIDSYVVRGGVEYRLIEPAQLSQLDFGDVRRGAREAGEGLADSSRAMGCVMTFGLWRPDPEVRRVAIQGYISRRIPGYAAMHLLADDHAGAYLLFSEAVGGVEALVPLGIFSEFEDVAAEAETGLFRDLKAIFLLEERFHNCGRATFVVDYIPLDEAFDSAPIIADAAEKIAFMYELCRRARRCP